MSSHSRYLTAAIVALCVVPGSVSAQPKKIPPVQADVAITYTLPDGRTFTRLGHYYRNSSGQFREDSALGTVITDTRRGTVTVISNERREARVLRVSRSAAPDVMPKTASMRPFATTLVEGRKVNKVHAKDSAGRDQEFWLDQDVALIVFARMESTGLKIQKELRHISTDEPSASLFVVPAGYTISDDGLRQPALRDR